ncbi:hypothetical protein ACROYT_G041808 [Oculina patagonica]
MSSANVLPSAPAYGDREETQLYPSLPTNAENFRLTEISKIEKEISAEAEHYRLVLKKYKKVRKVIHYSVVCLGAVTAALSSGAVATSLTGVGIVIGVPVAAVAAVSGAASTGLSVINKKLELKMAAEVTTTKSKIRARLAKKVNEREKLCKQRNNLRRKIRVITMDLETKEEEIHMVEAEIQRLELLNVQADEEVEED